MVTQELLNYIYQQIQQGVGPDAIRNTLTARGWQETDIQRAFNLIYNQQSQNVAPPQRPTTVLPCPLALFSHAWVIYRKKPLTFSGIMVVPYLVLFILSLLGFIITMVLPIFLSNITSTPTGGSFSTLALTFVGIILGITIFFMFGWGNVALIYAVKDLKENIGIKEAFKRSKHKVLSYWWVIFLCMVGVVVGAFLFIFPGMIFLIWFIFAPFVLVTEDVKGVRALSKSKEYVKGKWWSIFSRFLFLGLMFLVVSLIPIIGQFVSFLILSPISTIYYFLR